MAKSITNASLNGEIVGKDGAHVENKKRGSSWENDLHTGILPNYFYMDVYVYIYINHALTQNWEYLNHIFSK